MKYKPWLTKTNIYYRNAMSIIKEDVEQIVYSFHNIIIHIISIIKKLLSMSLYSIKVVWQLYWVITPHKFIQTLIGTIWYSFFKAWFRLDDE